MNDISRLDRGSVRHSIDFNERDLRRISDRRAAFIESVTKLADFAAAIGVQGDAVKRFHGAIDDAVSDLFYEITEDLEGDIDRDRQLLGEGVA